MKTLVIVGHPNPVSFNKSGILTTVTEALMAKGHEVVVRDLYEMGFNPILSGADFASFQTGQMPADIKAEQDYISWATNIIVIHPTWWIGRPAIVQGYYDRVLAFNFAFTVDQNGARGLLKNEKVLIINTAGTPENIYDGWPDSKALLSRPSVEGVFGYCGIKHVNQLQLFGVAGSSDEQRVEMLNKVKEAVAAL
jgi:NAD(P)H dehydrogenase (quinone)